MPSRDIYTVLFRTLENPTKLGIMFLLSHYGEMTVTQMSKLVGVGKPTLYHFVGQMVRDRLVSRPRVVVKKNYVEKYYVLNESAFALIDPAEQRKRLKTAKAEDLKAMFQAFLASLGLYLRLYSMEIAGADREKMKQIALSVSENRVMFSYLILPDEQYKYALSELRLIGDTLSRRWASEKRSLKGNRLIIVGLPELR